MSVEKTEFCCNEEVTDVTCPSEMRLEWEGHWHTGKCGNLIIEENMLRRHFHLTFSDFICT